MYINENLTRLYNSASLASTQTETPLTSATAASLAAAASGKSGDSAKVLSRVCMDVVSISSNYIETNKSNREDSTDIKIMQAAANIGRGAVSAYQEYLTGLEEDEEAVDTNNYEQLAKENLVSSRMSNIINGKA